MAAGYVIALVMLGTLLVLAYKLKDYIVEFKEYERSVVFRFGRYHRVAGPGWVLILPGIEKYVKYDLRAKSVDIPPQSVITKDGIELMVDAIIYLRVVDPRKAELFVEEDYQKAVTEYVKGRIRNAIGKLELAQLYGTINELNTQVREQAQQITKNWGVEVEDVELQGVSPPEDVVIALKAQEIAELEKAAAVEKAAALKIRINAIQESAGSLNDKALAYLYIQSLQEMAKGSATKIIFPLEFSKLAQRLSGEK